MFGQIFTNRSIRKYVIFFGSLFDNVYLTRDNASGERQQTMKVPLNYGPKEKFLARLEGNPDLDREIALQLPRMSFEITNMYYDSTRKLSSVGIIRCPDPNDKNKATYRYNPLPYNIDFDLNIMTKSIEDGYRILETILPFFGPEFTGTLKIFDDASYDIPVVLRSTNHTDSYEGEFTTRRALIWTLSFTLKGYLFGPTRSGGVIKQAEISIKIPPEFSMIDETMPPSVFVTTTPGLTANGEPTTDPSTTIDKSLIGPDDNYAYIVDIMETI